VVFSCWYSKLDPIANLKSPRGVFVLVQQARRSRDSSVGIATGYGLDDEGEREFESR
jgi:hypothetical protein